MGKTLCLRRRRGWFIPIVLHKSGKLEDTLNTEARKVMEQPLTRSQRILFAAPLADLRRHFSGAQQCLIMAAARRYQSLVISAGSSATSSRFSPAPALMDVRHLSGQQPRYYRAIPRPRSASTSPVIARSRLYLAVYAANSMAVAMVMPADWAVLGTAPSGGICGYHVYRKSSSI